MAKVSPLQTIWAHRDVDARDTHIHSYAIIGRSRVASRTHGRYPRERPDIAFTGG